MGDDDRKAETLYPAGEKQAAKIATPGGHGLMELTLENVLAGNLTSADIGIRPETLRIQAEVARTVDRHRLGENLERGAELVGVPQSEIFETYEKLRPGRAENKEELLEIAAKFRERYRATAIARLIEDAAEVYERRGLFRKRY